jgi:DNA-binding IclR family transcriptional regulator
VLYVARAATSRVMSVALNTGSRLPAYCTSLGRVCWRICRRTSWTLIWSTRCLRPMTPNTIVNPKRLREVLAGVRRDGYAINDEELELGLRSIAVPVRGASGTVLAALNVGAQAARVSVEQLQKSSCPCCKAARRNWRYCCRSHVSVPAQAGIHRTHALRLLMRSMGPGLRRESLRPVGGTTTLRTSGGCRS